jgi:8-oxo-dGTP pyrophosphatase MutT (NUDIX family)
MENPVNHVNKYASGVAVLYQNSILLAKRVERWNGILVPYGGYWSIFGGTIEDGENAMMCAVRELEEESQIKISTKDLKFIKKIIDEDVEFVFYITELTEFISPILNEEHTEYGWFKIDSLRDFPYKLDPKIKECVLSYKKMCK